MSPAFFIWVINLRTKSKIEPGTIGCQRVLTPCTGMCTSVHKPVHSVPLFFKNPGDFTIRTQVKSHITTPLKSQVFIQHNSFRGPSKHQSSKL